MILNLITKAKELLYKNGKNVEEALDEVNSNLTNISSIRTSDVLDTNNNPFPPNAFKDSAVSLGYAYGVFMGINISAYIPILTMRWYETSNIIRTVQVAFDGKTTYTRYSVSASEWGEWESSATNSDFTTVTAVTSEVGTVSGGYVKVGKVVTVSARIKLTQNVVNNETRIFDGLPTPESSYLPLTTFNVDGGKNVDGYLVIQTPTTASLKIRTDNTNILTTGYSFMLSGSYLSAN